MESCTIALIGDSVLDNFYWLENNNSDLKYELENRGYNVNNFAVDESRLENIISGIIPNPVYVNSRSYPYPIDDYKVNPLELIKNTKNDVIVCSIGGNDMRANIMTLFCGIDAFINRTFTQNFMNKFNNLLLTLVNKASKVILVSVYIPYLGKGSPYAMVNGMHTTIYERIRNIYYDLGKKYNIPVIDLSLTFDPFNRAHYGSTEIEPSNLSNTTIANLIDYVTKNYRGYNVYYAPQCGEILSL